MRNLCPRNWPSNWQSGTTDKMLQQLSNNFPVHQCISWDILLPGMKWDILSDGTICRPKNASGTMVSLWICRRYCPRYIQNMPEIRASFAQGMGLQIEIVGQNVAGEGASVGTLCRWGGARCSGTFCRWDILSPNRILSSGGRKHLGFRKSSPNGFSPGHFLLCFCIN